MNLTRIGPLILMQVDEATEGGGGGGGVATALAMKGIDMLMGGFSAVSNRDAVGMKKDSVWSQYQSNINFLDRANKQAIEGIGFKYRQAKEGLDIGTGGMLFREKEKLASDIRKRGFAGDQEMTSRSERDMNKLWSRYTSNQKALSDTRSMSLEAQGLSHEKQKFDLAVAHGNQMEELDAIPTTFFEGMFA